MKKLLSVVLCLFFVSCTNGEGTIKLLESQGYTDVKITGYRWFSCSKDDFFHTGFIAETQNGQIVEGAVCEGLLFKGKTIRFD